VVEGGGQKHKKISQGSQFTSQIQSCGLFEYKWCYVQESYGDEEAYGTLLQQTVF
jgi:hypothetical protein